MSTTTTTPSSSILPRQSRRARPARNEPSLFQRWARTAIEGRLEGLVGGRVRVHDDEGTREFGDGRGKAIEVRVRSPRLYARLAREGSLGAGTSWIEGDWECNDLPALLRLLVAQPGFVGPSGRLDSFLARGESALRTLASPLTKNTRGGSRRNISAHYDLGNDFYAAMLDPSMTYSSGIFSFPDEPLESAQTEKYDRLCRQLDLRPSHRLLEIGTGWGGFALHAAKHYGCHVTTTTISAEQRALALERVEAAGLSDRIDVRFDDYRDLTGRYDRLVSIEMIEAVGAEYLDRFVQVCSDRLEPDGVMGLQAIVIADQLYERSKRHVDFIKRYVFPGGFLPSVAAISDRVARVSDFRIQDIHDITADYAETLRRWRANLDESPEAYAAVDDSGAFERLWAYYLAYCEAGFEERRIGCVQMTLTKSGWRPGR